MLLGVEPAGLASPQLNSALNTVGRDHSREVGQRNHHAVWVAVQMGRIQACPDTPEREPDRFQTRHGIDLDRSLRDRPWYYNTMMVMTVPYESTGRTRQKQRTRDALVAATRTLLAHGATPTVEESADASGISRTTAYRYFPNQRTLLLAAIPEIDRASMLDASAPKDVATRLDLVITAQTKILRRCGTQLRAALGSARAGRRNSPERAIGAASGPGHRLDRRCPRTSGHNAPAHRPQAARHRHPCRVRHRSTGLADRCRPVVSPRRIGSDALFGAGAAQRGVGYLTSQKSVQAESVPDQWPRAVQLALPVVPVVECRARRGRCVHRGRVP